MSSYGGPASGETHASVTYTSYLRVDELLTLQQPRSPGPEHDEMLFIVIHQVYELWFKEVLHELAFLKRALEANDHPATLSTLNRVRTILKTLVSQVDILETMTPVQFSSFRARLEAASGFQSVQFREIEFALGKKNAALVARFPPGKDRSRLDARLAERTVWDSFLTFLASNGYEVPKDALERDVTQPLEPSPDVQAILVRVYREDHAIGQVCERLVDVDEGLQEWRYRHVKMVERTIGTKMGTGGSAGADYLRATLFRPHFPDLWAIRSSL